MPKKKIFSMLLTLFLFTCLFFLKVSADSSDVMLSWDHFSGEYFQSSNATLSSDENGFLNVSFRRTAPEISIKVNYEIAKSSQNAIRLSLVNNSACNSLLVTYRYQNDDGEMQSISEKISLVSRGIRGDYYVYTSVAHRITEMTLAFSGVSSGSITISTIDFVSLYDDGEDSCGRLTACAYDQKENAIRVSGTVNYQIVTSHRKARLVLYAVDMDVTSLPYGSIPLASVPMSSHFDFLLPKVSIDERLKAYVVAVVSEGGELLDMFSPRIPTTETKELEEKGFFKGVHSEIGVLAARANAELSIVDVDFAKLTSSNVGEGILYAFDGEYFYFNRQYLSLLDARVQRSYENGSEVALRFLTSEVHDTKFSPLLADSEENLLRLHAYTRFLCERYSSNARGVVSQIVFGTCADDILLDGDDMIQYTRLYADSLFAVSEAAAATEREIRLVLPLSDCTENGKTDNVFFSPRIFLVSLGKLLQKRYVGGVRISVMIESDALSGDGTPYGALGFESIGDFSSFLRQIHDAYPAISERYLYYWEPSETKDRDYLKASLLHGYYAVACERNTYGFVLSTADISDVSLVTELMSILQFANTKLGEKNAYAALATLGKDKWRDLILSYTDVMVYTTEYRETYDATVPPFRFLGETYLWDFSGMGNDYGWIMGDGCNSVIMEKYEKTNRALAATMYPHAENNYESELIYRFDEIRSFAYVDALSFAVCVDASMGKYRITIQICGENEISESSLLVSAGELSAIYVNTADLFENESVRSIRIFTTPVSGNLEEYTLLIGSISAHSTELTDEFLELNLKEIQSIDMHKENLRVMTPVWIYATLFMVFVSVMIIVVLAFRSEEEK